MASIIKQAHFPQPPKQTVVIIAKGTKSFLFFDSLGPPMKEASNILTAAMDTEEQKSG